MSETPKWGSALKHTRTWMLDKKRRRRACGICGCQNKSTHLGLANGIALMGGCEWHVKRWCRDPLADMRIEATKRLEQRERGER